MVIDAVPAGSQPCWVIAEKSPYFIVGGGQVPDQGTIIWVATEVPFIAVNILIMQFGTNRNTSRFKIGDQFNQQG